MEAKKYFSIVACALILQVFQSCASKEGMDKSEEGLCRTYVVCLGSALGSIGGSAIDAAIADEGNLSDEIKNALIGVIVGFNVGAVLWVYANYSL